ncbi:DUF3883 domain-containing protein [Paraburkholderia flagellata]|uniref:DUF3883 domain-containing protein n=1 Tax=Paraburkholderia flagellata TaxID=2883241 RepID=UPI001F1C4385|nr:DUF3883 domain-containing protein [Paraburkholderia flagellata]
MATATLCNYDQREITIEEAIRLRQTARANELPTLTFACTECGRPVRPHQGGGHTPAHFEHLRRNRNCSLSHKPTDRTHRAPKHAGSVDTAELARLTAGGDDYIRTKDGEVKGLALRLDLNEGAPDVIVVGKGPRIEHRAMLLRDTPHGVPTYVKRGTNSWEYLGEYKATAYRIDAPTIKQYRGERPASDIAGILFLESVEAVSVTVRGGGFADPQTRREIEEAAINFVKQELRAQGFAVEDRQRENCGYDLLARRGQEEILYEVKGADAVVPRFFISRNERRCSMLNENWRLAVVTSARTTPRLHVLTPAEMEERFTFECLAWECTITNPAD